MTPGWPISCPGRAPRASPKGRSRPPPPPRATPTRRGAAARAPQGARPGTFAQGGFIPAVVEKDRNQAEFSRSLQDYLLTGVSDARVENGRAAMARHAGTLAAVESTYGVDKEVVAAVWGMESSYGTRKGDVPIVSALSTLAYEGRRAQFFETELLSALRILARGDTTPQ